MSSVEPGKHYTLLLEVTNHSKRAVNLNFEYKIPSGFNSLLSKKEKSIAPLSKKNIIFTFSISKYCNAGNFNIVINAKENGLLAVTKMINLEVEKVYNLEVEPIKYPNYLRFEKEFSCEYLITNNGNSEEKIKFLSNRAINVSPNSAFLKPDSTVVVTVTQSVPFSPFNKTIALNLLKAEIAVNGKLFSNRIPITVYPNSTKKPDLYHRFPIAISTIFNSLKGIDTVSAFKFRLEGAGFLDTKKEHYLDFFVSGPNQKELIRFGEYDEYKLNYRNNRIELFAGDISYTLSNLTEASRSGFGGILNYKFSKSEATIFYLDPRFTSEISSSYGGDFKWYLSPKTALKLGFINRILIENNSPLKSQIYSLSSSYSGGIIKLNGEIAYENNEITSGIGFSAESFLNTNKLYWVNLIQYSDKDFKGYLRNSKQLTSYLNYQIFKKFSLQLNVNYRSINPQKDDINFSTSPIIQNYRGSFNYKLNRKNKLKFGLSLGSKEDRFDPKKFNFKESLLNLNYSYQNSNKFYLRVSNRYGTSKNLLASNSDLRNVLFSAVDCSVSLLDNLSLGVSANYESTNKNSLSNELQNSFYYGGNLIYEIGNTLNLNFFYRSDYAIDEIEEDAQSYIEAILDYNYNSNHQFSFSVSQSSIPSPDILIDKELFIKASYSFIINTPLSKDKTIGSIKGKIRTMDDENLEGILISLGNKATVTDKNGEFIIYNLEPKEYLLNIAQSSLPKNKIVVENLPLKIDVIPNKESLVELTLGKTGSFTGQVILKETNSIQSTKFLKKLPKIVVKIYNKDEKFLTQTNKTGSFKFAKLTPGKWTIELLVKNLLKDFTFDKIEEVIEIKPDQNTFIIFNVANKKRVIKKSKKTFKL